MAEKRQQRRYKRRLLVKYGEKDLSLTGFTGDVSVGGMFVTATGLLPLDRRVHLQLFVDTSRYLLFEGEVRRHKVVPPQMRTVERGGFGVRFLYPGEVLADALGKLGGRFEMHYKTAEEFKAAYQRELRNGGLFLITPMQILRDTQVTLELCLDYAKKTFEVEATVVHLSTGDTALVKGVGVAFNEPQKIEAMLRPHSV